MNEVVPAIWAMSALSIIEISVLVYFAIFFMILYGIFWGIVLIWKVVVTAVN